MERARSRQNNHRQAMAPGLGAFPKASAEGWAAVAEGQTKLAKPAQGRAKSELRDSPTRLQGGAAPKK
ncbi:hypothetical protein SGRA_1942 [Saprospira grandis str. Lewin]|uniref:Uncharacterized protein n=1 Tax=Saprospira grandis (strain Lewin) TaxID=984262 RepID=H6L1M9_SAPGL|nr:hypothetical protein SGRA_1942 [Saprospira grandis str. Lewin]